MTNNVSGSFRKGNMLKGELKVDIFGEFRRIMVVMNVKYNQTLKFNLMVV